MVLSLVTNDLGMLQVAEFLAPDYSGEGEKSTIFTMYLQNKFLNWSRMETKAIGWKLKVIGCQPCVHNKIGQLG